MKIVAHSDPAAFLAAAGPFLETHAVENGLMLGIAERLVGKDDHAAFLAAIEDGGEVLGAALQTPPRSLILSDMPAGAAGLLAEFLRHRGAYLPGVLGPERPVEEFARRWATLTGAVITPGMPQNLYRCDRLNPLPPAPGALRLARPDEAPLAADWNRRFVAEVGLSAEELASAVAMVGDLVGGGRLWWWDDGGPVAMTAVATETAAACRINAVMTRPEKRRRGYGAACVAAVTRLCLDRGKYCFLHADANNAHTNRLYRRIGYRMVSAERELRFSK